MANRDFNDDRKDAGEIGAGHHVTALYELVPAAGKTSHHDASSLKYQKTTQTTVPSDESLTVRIRYKLPDGDKGQELERGVVDEGKDLSLASDDFRLAAAVAEFGMLLRGSPHKGQATYAALLELSEPLCTRDPEGYRRELVDLVRKASALAGR